MLHFLPLLYVIVVTVAEASIEPYPHQEVLQDVVSPVAPSLVKVTSFRNELDVDSGVSGIFYSSEEVLEKPDVVHDNIEMFVFEEKGLYDKFVESNTQRNFVTEIGNLNLASDMNRKLFNRVRHVFNSVHTDTTTLTLEPGYGGKEAILENGASGSTGSGNGRVFRAFEKYNIHEQHTSSTPESIDLIRNREATRVDKKNIDRNQDRKALEDNSSDENLESMTQQNKNVNESQSTASNDPNTGRKQKSLQRRKPNITTTDIVVLILIACGMVVWSLTAMVIFHIHF